MKPLTRQNIEDWWNIEVQPSRKRYLYRVAVDNKVLPNKQYSTLTWVDKVALYTIDKFQNSTLNT